MEDLTSIINHSSDLWTRYQQSSNIDDLEELISLERRILTLRPLGQPDRDLSLNNLAAYLTLRYQQLGEIEDLEEAVSFNRDALILRPNGHLDRSASLNNLATALWTLYQQSGELDELEESISLNREALALRPPAHPLRPTSISNLASGLWILFQQTGQIEDLEESVSLMRDGLALQPPGHPDRSTSLNNLAGVLWTIHQQSSKIEELEECISLNREALALRPPGHLDRSTSLNSLGTALLSRFKRSGRMEDLDESIELQREGLSLRPLGHPDRPSSLGNLATTIHSLYGQTGGIEALEESISLNREVLTLRQPGNPDRSFALNGLATFLSTRYEELGEIQDLEESIILNREALALRPPGHPHRSSSLSNLGLDLFTRYKGSGEIENLEESISLYREALSVIPADHPDCADHLVDFANALDSRHQLFGKPEDVEEMFTCYEQGARSATSYLAHRLGVAIKWSQIAREHNHQSTLNAHTISLELLHRALISRPDVEAQHRYLAKADIPRSMASDAASAAIGAGNLELAVEFLEQGRAMLWSKIDAYKSPLEQLRQVEGGEELADLLEKLSVELEHLVLLSDRGMVLDEESSTGIHSLDARIKRHRILSEEWEALAERIREIPGFAYFLQTPPFHTLRTAAAEGPVILVNISDYRSDVIILTIDNPPLLVPLSTIEPTDLADQVNQLKSNQGIISVLRYLWNNIVSHVVASLIELGIETKCRIWWCPTAELCALPIHAAGPYRPREANLPDLYTSSYATTLSALIRARSNIIQLPEVPKLLVVGQPNETLQKVGGEVEIIQQYGVVDTLLGAEASHEAVLDGLRQHSWVHFACHGHLGDDNQPFQASFELHNGRRLTLLELIQARLPKAESAFLAACHSAAGDSKTPDENLHLSAALQFCGFRSVVGTLWEMYDEDGPMISKEFYKYMFRNPERVDFRDSAQALSFAVREMRKARLPPERWVMFVHIGA